MGIKEVAERGEGPLVEDVPQVVQAIGQISNYFGSTPALYSERPVDVAGQPLAGRPAELAGRPAELADQPGEPAGRQVETPGQINTEVLDTGGKADVSGAKVSGHVTSQHENTTIGLLSHEDIGRLAGEIAQQFREDGKEEAQVPSYAPEKCITSDNGYASKQEPGKGSPLPITTLPVPEAGEVSKLEGMLVSEKDIFGATLPEDDEEEGGEFGGGEGEGLGGDDTGSVDCGGHHGDDSVGDEPIKITLSQAEMMEEFKKLTSLSQDKLSK